MGGPNPDLQRKLERQVFALAKSILDGRVPVLPNAQRMNALLFRLGLRHDDRVKAAFTAMVSETAHLPIGTERQYWAASALSRKDEEIAEAEAWARGLALEACREIVLRYGGPVGS
ncbi:MAG TPA: DUF2489 domain-containing protein [Longimicrobium sp.]